MRKVCTAFIIFLFNQSFGQQTFTAVVENETTGLAMPSIHILNLTQTIGTITNRKGEFEIVAEANDTLYFSYLGYKPLKIALTNDMMVDPSIPG